MKDKNQKFSVWNYFSKYKGWLVAYVTLYLVIAVAEFFITIQIANFLNEVALSEIKKAFITILYIIGLCAVSNGINWFCAMVYFKYSNKIALEIKKDITKRILKINNESMDRTPSGLIINRINNDPERLIGSLDDVIYTLWELLNRVLVIVYIAIINIWIALVILGIIVVVFLIEFVKVRIYKKKLARTEKLGEPATSITSEMVRSQKDIKTFGLEEQFQQTFTTHYEKYKDANCNLNMTIYTLDSVKDLISNWLIYGLVAFALFMMDQGIIALASLLFIFTNRSSISSFAFFIGNLGKWIADFKVRRSRISELYDEEMYASENYGEIDVQDLKGEIEFKNVAFDYVNKKEKEVDEKTKSKRGYKPEFEITTQRIFEDLSFKIKANSTVAFIGKSGSGKSTILNLIAKLNDCTEGEILLGGYDINTLSKKSIRDNLVLVNQFPYIFDMTIKENIKLAKPDATDEEVLKACKDSNLIEYLDSLPNGLDTKVGENGVKMSGGQKQRLAIARALIKNSRIIIFDESTSSLDNIAQAEITKSIQNLSGKHTVIIVAHRLSTIKNVDTIYYLDKGKIVDKGNFEELYERNDSIRKMFLAENLESED
ncbi:MAG: ABC transporter ATP-binding protein [Clostridia bacterium]|nr:ABC transporter ATP-binding protein [Clostridia bacterium]